MTLFGPTTVLVGQAITLAADARDADLQPVMGAGGNPGGFRRMTHTLTKQTAPDFVTLFVEHRFTGATYDPSKQGAIASLDYSEDHQSAASDEYTALLVVQNGVSYRAEFPNNSAFPIGTWQTARLTGLRASDFTPAGLNFSATGGPMTFGYVRGNSARFVTTITHDIDNWQVTIHR